MPQRPRAHLVEELSLRRFAEKLPNSWLPRPVLPDYGVDREIEIFDVDGKATGLKLAVQLKATDDGRRADRVSIKVDLIDYLVSLENLAIIVRYDSTTDIFRWQWAKRIRTNSKVAKGQKSFTHRFDASDVWNEDTPGIIERALQARRALRSFPPSFPMPIRLNIDASAEANSYSIERALHNIIDGSGASLVSAGEELIPVEMKVYARSGYISLNLDEISGVSFDIDTSDKDLLESAMLYAMVVLFAQNRLYWHAKCAGKAILIGRHFACNIEMAISASVAFSDDPMALAELAILNELHIAETGYYPFVLTSLIEKSARTGDMAPVERFLTAALGALDGDPLRAALIHYSSGNALRTRNAARAMSHYIRAKRLRPEYKDADYFLREVAGTLFNIGRYKWAANFYSRAAIKNPDPAVQLLLGDALLRSGNAQVAAVCFDRAMQSEQHLLAEEATVKLLLSESLVSEYGPVITTDWSRPMADVLNVESGRIFWQNHLAKVNALDPLAQFNLGVDEMQRGQFKTAVVRFIACATIQNNDVEAWVNATITAFQAGEMVLALILLRLSIRLVGLSAYDDIRKRIVAKGSFPDLIAELDKFAIQAHKVEDGSLPPPVTVRVIEGDKVHVYNLDA
jgi:tetratricopeptide (TPR) repeat protein